jgi:hypothetical protein
MSKNKQRFNLSIAVMIAFAIWLIASIVLYWIFIQIYPPPPPSTDPVKKLPIKPPPNEIRLQLPTKQSPKLEPDIELNREPIKQPKPLESKKNPNNSIENPIESLKEEPEKEKDLSNDSKLNIIAKLEEPAEISKKLTDTLKNISKSEMIATPVPKSAELENRLPSSWISVSEKIMIIENKNSQLIDIINRDLSADKFKLEDQDDELVNKKWSTVGEQLIKLEQQMNKSVKELHEKTMMNGEL